MSNASKPCEVCGRVFERNPKYSARQWAAASFCSRSCAGVGRPVRDAGERFWEMVDKTDEGCWLWTGAITRAGYGLHRVGREGDGTRKQVLAHRFAYEDVVGPIPEGLQLDHVRARGCVHRHCVNPAHLEAVTGRENIMRSSSPTAINAAKTECVNGHLFTAANTYRSRAGRHCRTCRAEADRRHKSRIRGGALVVAALFMVSAPSVATGADARHATLPPALSKVSSIKAIFPGLWKAEQARKDGVRWNRLRRAARTEWMLTHACADATLERRYRLGAESSWGTVVATWRCDGVPAWEQAFLSCAADHEGGRTRPDVWYRGDSPTPVVGWHPEFVGTDRVVGHIQSRPYHASKVAPGIYDRTVTRETFEVITDPVNHARIAAAVGVGAFAATTQAACS